MIPGTASFPVQDHNRLYRRKTREKSVSVLPKEKNWFESECWTGRETGKEWPWRNKRDSDRCCSYRDNVCLIPLIIWLMTKTSAKTTIYLFKGGTSRDNWKFRHWLDYECRCDICLRSCNSFNPPFKRYISNENSKTLYDITLKWGSNNYSLHLQMATSNLKFSFIEHLNSTDEELVKNKWAREFVHFSPFRR